MDLDQTRGNWQWVVVDPKLLVEAFAHRQGREAQLLALFMYGAACGAEADLLDEIEMLETAAALPPALRLLASTIERAAKLTRHVATIRKLIPDAWELSELYERASSLALARGRLDQDAQVAKRRQADLKEAFSQPDVPDGLLLVTSPRLKHDLRVLAGDSRRDGNHSVLRSDVIRDVTIASYAYVSDPDVGAWEANDRAYLVHTALPEAASLVTDDPVVREQCENNGVPVYWLDEFIAQLLGAPGEFDFNRIDAPAVWKAARASRTLSTDPVPASRSPRRVGS